MCSCILSFDLVHASVQCIGSCLSSKVEYARVVKPKDARTSFLESGAPPAATASQLEEQLYANVPFTCPPPEPLPLERIVEEVRLTSITLNLERTSRISSFVCL